MEKQTIDLAWLLLSFAVGLILAIVLIAKVLLRQRQVKNTHLQKLDMTGKNEEKYRDIFNWSPVGIYQATVDGTLLTVNPALVEMLGYDSADELLQRNIGRDIYWSEEECGAVLAHHARALSAVGVEVLWKKKDGMPIWVQLNAHPVQDNSGRMLYVEGFVHDITERKLAEQASKQAEEALRSSEEKYRRFFEEDLSGIFTSTPDGRLIDCNPRFACILGFTSVEEALSVNAYSMYEFPAERDKYLQLLREKRRLENYERTLIRKDGKKIHVIANVVGDFDERGELVRIRGHLFDVTERKQAEEKYRTLFEESKDAIFISTPEGKLVDINPAGVELFGYSSQEEMLQIDIARDMYWNSADREKFQRMIKRQGYVKDFELELKRKDGQKLIALETTTVVRDEKGNILAYRGIMHDITDQKKLEDQLRQAQKMESIGTLAGGIAHDFNNILGIIRGHLAMIERSKNDAAKIVHSLEALNKAVERAASLVRQLLTFARKTDAQLESMNVNAAVEEIANILKETFPKTITLSLELEKNLPSIVADHNQLHQALLNLCVNALEAMMEPFPAQSKASPSRQVGIWRGGTLTLRTSIVTGSELRERFPEVGVERYVCITIGDTGIGMDEVTRSRIFEPFFTTKQKGKGTGLGLAVVYGVVQSHEGFVDVESELGKGTTFYLYFPVPQRIRQALAAKPVEKRDEAPGGSETILLVEDEEMLLELVRNILQEKGYRVLAAKDGEEAVDIYRQNKDEISLVLSDMGLPKLGGWDAFRKMKEINPNVRSILASGYLDPHIKSEMLKAGAKDFIQKPYDVNEILRRIREVIDSTPTPA